MMENYLLPERNIELAAEGKRWYDMIRYAKSKNYAHKSPFLLLWFSNTIQQRMLVGYVQFFRMSMHGIYQFMRMKLKITPYWYRIHIME